LLRDITHESLGLPPLAPANPFKKWLTENFNCSLRSFSEIERNQIFVNNVLNSISVDEEVIKYLIYHECLHQEIHDHSKAFRDKEHKYPDFQKWDNFLDYKFRDYTKDYN